MLAPSLTLKIEIPREPKTRNERWRLSTVRSDMFFLCSSGLASMKKDALQQCSSNYVTPRLPP